MLKGIPAILSPQLLKALCEMGHGDTLIIADGNFPAESIGKNGIVIRLDGHSSAEVLEAVLELVPLDSYVAQPVHLMEVVNGDPVETAIWYTYEEIVKRKAGLNRNAIGYMERFAFYDEAKKAYVIIATGETALYANILLQKGVVKPESS